MIKSLKNQFPFRLGTTSYIIPADLITNVRFLAPLVDDIELILFEADDASNLPDEKTITALNEIARSNDLSYTVHLPLGLSLGAVDKEERLSSVNKALRVAELTRPLNPVAYILHFEGERRGPVPSENMTGWINGLRLSVRELLDTEIPPFLFCVETLDYPFALVDPIVYDFDLSVCLDIGHILLRGYPLDGHLAKYHDKLRVFHAHGILGNKDHRDLGNLRDSDLALLFGHLQSWASSPPVLTLEVFDENDFRLSLEVVERMGHQGA
ncbi:MAG TPA: xylose isomerase [Deltaproteobacteria bacterium]|nr:xylose isomerase [Deltaproteobacteria bacterium]